MGLAIIISGVSFAEKNLGQVTEALPIESITLNSDDYVYNNKNIAYCKAIIIPDNVVDKNVSWSIVKGEGFATIDSTGKITILSSANNNAVTIRCTSMINPSVFAEKNIVVSYSNPSNVTGFYNRVKKPFLVTSTNKCLADTTLREVNVAAIEQYHIAKLHLNSSFTLSGNMIIVKYDKDFRIIEYDTTSLGKNMNAIHSDEPECKYMSFSIDAWSLTGTDLSLLDAVHEAYENITFDDAFIDKDVSLENFKTL